MYCKCSLEIESLPKAHLITLYDLPFSNFFLIKKEMNPASLKLSLYRNLPD